MRRTVDLWAIHKQTAPSTFQTYNRVQLWEHGGRRKSRRAEILLARILHCAVVHGRQIVA